MSYVAYHKDTTRFLRNHPKVRTDKTSFATEAAAKSAITREVKVGAIVAEDFLVAEKRHFYAAIEKQVTVKNILSGQPVTHPINTPLCCDPSSETYHSM